jgi:hypothetical protein
LSVTTVDTHAQLVESLDQLVREAVRREGVDPQREAVVVRRLAEAVVRAHDERSLTGVVAPVSDVESMVGELVARVSGFGPLQAFLDDPAVEEIWGNDPSNRSTSSMRTRLPSARTASLAVFQATPRPSATRATVRWPTTIPSSAHRRPRRDNFARGSAARLVSWRHT